MSFFKRFFDPEKINQIEVVLPQKPKSNPWVKRFVFTLAAAAMAVSSAPWAQEQLELSRIAQLMSASNRGAASAQEIGAAKDAITFYNRFLSNAHILGNVTINITDRLEAGIQEGHRFSRATEATTAANQIAQCTLSISSDDLAGLSTLAQSQRNAVDSRHTVYGLGHDIRLAGDLLAARTQCMLEASGARDNGHHIEDSVAINAVIQGASYAHASILLAQQLGSAAAQSFALTMEDMYGGDSVIVQAAKRGSVWAASQPDGAQRVSVTTGLGAAMKMAQAIASDNMKFTEQDKLGFLTLVQHIPAEISTMNNQQESAVLNINGKMLTWGAQDLRHTYMLSMFASASKSVHAPNKSVTAGL